MLLGGPDRQPALHLGERIDRAALRELVGRHERRLRDAGLAADGTATLVLPPSLGFVALAAGGLAGSARRSACWTTD